MISQNLIRPIETHAADLAESWLNEVCKNLDTITYHSYPHSKLIGRIENIYSHLGYWVNKAPRDEIADRFLELGATRFQQGFQLSEVVKALVLAKRVLWDFVELQGFAGAGELYQVLELEDALNLFFDRAIFFTVKGFERESRVQRSIHEAENNYSQYR